MARVVDEIDNLRAAFVWSLENGDPGMALTLASALQPLWLTRGRISEGRAWLDAARDAGQSVEPAILAQATADMAVLASWVDNSGISEQAMAALAIARELKEPALLVRVLYGCACITAHDADLAQPYFTEAADLARQLGDSWRLSQILGRQSTGGLLSGDVVAAQQIGEEGRQLADAIGDFFNSRQCRMNIAWASMCRGETATAVREYRDVITEARAAKDVMSEVSALIPAAFAFAYHGDVDGARTASAEALKACAELGFLLQNGYFTVTLAELAAGDAATARQASDAAMRSATNIVVQDFNLTWAAAAELAGGDVSRARELIDRAVATADNLNNNMFLCLALAVRARVHIAEGRKEEAATDAYDGLAIAAPMGAYLGVPDLFECLAEAVSDTEFAVRLLGAACTIRKHRELPRFHVYNSEHQSRVARLRKCMGDSEFHTAWAQGAEMSAEEAIAYALRGRGERKRPSSGWDSLTPTELDVVRLVGEGLPNKDIATRLFVSPRTVQSHLRHVYNKLDLTSRVQLAQEAASRNRNSRSLAGGR
jgi:DNA-binding CsgD family transcriptional regulator